MNKERTQELSENKSPRKPLRLKAGVIIAILTILVRFIIPAIIPGAAAVGVLGGMLGGLAILVWWAFFSGAPRLERWGAVALIIVTMVATSQIIDESISTAMQGLMFPAYALPVLCTVFVIWAVATRYLADKLRWALMILAIVVSSGAWTLVRSEGITGLAVADFVWRWSDTYEELLLANSSVETSEPSSYVPVSETKAEWPGFRGPGRDGIAYDTKISEDWSVAPPAELWRKPIGPGCSSFAVHGNLIYTQEQRGEDEIVSCYKLSTGEAVWKHHDEGRFWDSHAGAGPRSTPTLSNGRVYTFGATGILNVLEAGDGTLVWSRNLALDSQVEIPAWGFCSSPVVTGDVVIVALAGTLFACDLTSGEPRWHGQEGGKGYSSPHLLEIDGVPQVLLMNDRGAISVEPRSGELLWEYPWQHSDRILQPAMTPDGNLLLSTGGKGTCSLKVQQGDDGWSVEEQWKAVMLKSFFNDLVVHKDLAFGFSGPFLECFDITTGKKSWKGGRYGGQLILLADQDLLVVLSEKGELVLVEASSDQFRELGKYPAIEGKTWNHPVVVGDIVLVRNSQEMLALQL